MKRHVEHTKLNMRLHIFKTRDAISLKININFEKIESLLVIGVMLAIELLRLII